MDEKRYMINPDTGVIYDYNPLDIKANKKLKECTADGVVFGRSATPVDELYARINELEMMLAGKDIRIEALENQISELTMKHIRENAETVRRRELEDAEYSEIKMLAADMGILAVGKKNDLIAAILEKERTKKEFE